MNRIFWSNSGNDTIYSAEFNANGIIVLNTEQQFSPPAFPKTIDIPTGLTILNNQPISNNRLFWANLGGGGTIFSAKFKENGTFDSGQKEFKSNPDKITSPFSLPMTMSGDRIFWANANESTIFSAKFSLKSGKFLGAQTQFNPPAGTIDTPEGMIIKGNRLFWGNFAGSIHSAELNSNGTAKQGTHKTFIPMTGGTIDGPRDLAISDHRLFWSNDNDTIYSATFDGAGNITSDSVKFEPIPANIAKPSGLVIKDKRLFWVNIDISTIFSAKFNADGTINGTEQQLNATPANISDPRFLALVPDPLVIPPSPLVITIVDMTAKRRKKRERAALRKRLENIKSTINILIDNAENIIDKINATIERLKRKRRTKIIIRNSPEVVSGIYFVLGFNPHLASILEKAQEKIKTINKNREALLMAIEDLEPTPNNLAMIEKMLKELLEGEVMVKTEIEKDIEKAKQSLEQFLDDNTFSIRGEQAKVSAKTKEIKNLIKKGAKILSTETDKLLSIFE